MFISIFTLAAGLAIMVWVIYNLKKVGIREEGNDPSPVEAAPVDDETGPIFIAMPTDVPTARPNIRLLREDEENF